MVYRRTCRPNTHEYPKIMGEMLQRAQRTTTKQKNNTRGSGSESAVQTVCLSKTIETK